MAPINSKGVDGGRKSDNGGRGARKHLYKELSKMVTKSRTAPAKRKGKTTPPAKTPYGLSPEDQEFWDKLLEGTGLQAYDPDVLLDLEWQRLEKMRKELGLPSRAGIKKRTPRTKRPKSDRGRRNRRRGE